MSDLMRKKECRHGLIDPDLGVHRKHPEWAACMGFGLVPVEPVGRVEIYGADEYGKRLIEFDDVPDGKYLIVEVDDAP